MKTSRMMKGLLAVVCCLLVINVIPHGCATTDHFTNNTILIIGKCNTTTTPALWLFGLKWMQNKNVVIQAGGGQGEQLNALILLSKIGLYIGYENIAIQMYGVKGLFFWGEKAVFLQKSQRIFALCKATDIWVNY